MGYQGPTISPEIALIFTAVDHLSATIENVQQELGQLNQTFEGARRITVTAGQAVHRVGVSMRGVAMDLRMVSIATAIFRREFEITNPTLEAASRSLLIVSTGATAVLATVDLLSKAARIAKMNFTILGTSIAIAGSALVAFIAVAAAGIAIIAAISWYFSPAQIAAREYADELASLTEIAEEAKIRLEGLRLEMQALAIQNQILTMAENELARIQEIRSFATEEEEATTRALKFAKMDVRQETDRGKLAEMEAGLQRNTALTQIKTIEREIAQLPQWRVPGRPLPPRILGGARPEVGIPGPFLPPGRGGQMGFPETYMGGIRVSDLMDVIGERGERPIHVAISFPGSSFATELDIISAVREAASEGANEILRRIA